MTALAFAGLTGFARLARLHTHDFIFVANTLAFVGFWRVETAQISRHLAGWTLERLALV